ncbi:invasion associated locus B family protein [Actibacterium sp. XHP0104]|uniref:invasion associated locus B family protein n=1 Tax=Actibacterium sp. XHP0104 TaxID=2984335 RepID=UPI0021E920F8|nr:invasion associated locus B family protein [Actibacterium sp. XHP0104]MCV2881735.1 invasion associated locus B family protein [Actibacterium sp. XHP0104]
MKSWVKRGITGAFVACIATGALAQQVSENQVEAHTDWKVYAEPPASPSECWGVTVPKKTVNTDSSGRIKAVSRGEILLFVTYRPKSGVKGEIAFTGGYPFAKDSFVEMEVAGAKYQLFTDGEWAWPASAGDDAKILAAMKRGSDATLTARSARGTITKDTFSLLGFTAASDSAEKYCGG